MKLVVLESPYAGDIRKNRRYARACLRDCLKQEEAAIASHLLYTQPGVLKDEVPAERSLGMSAGWEWFHVVDYVVVYTDLGISSGMKEGIEQAIRLKKNIIFRQLGGNWNAGH